MKGSTVLTVASLLAFSWTQETTRIPDEPPPDDSGPTTTLAPEVCPTAGLSSCYEIQMILVPPTSYLILTFTGSIPASLAMETTITSGDPNLTQPPVSAIVAITYSESDGTTCDPETKTSTLTNNNDVTCPVSFTFAPTVAPPGQVIKTRVFLKERDVEASKKSGESTPLGPAPIITGESTTSGESVSSQSEPTYVPTTESTSSTASVTTTDTTATDSNYTTDSTTTLTSSQQTTTTGYNEELMTSYTTLTEVSNGVTNYKTKPIATVTRSLGSTTSTSVQGTGAAGGQKTIAAGVLIGALGFAALLGL